MHPRAGDFAERAADEFGFDVDVHEFPEGTKTAADAAEAIGCDVAQIASSIALSTDGGLVVVVTSGANRVDFSRVAELLADSGSAEFGSVDGDDVSMADAGDVKETLGWSIGGVPPFCHDADVPVLMDETLTGYDEVWAAAGTPEAVFPIDPATLRELAGATVATVAE